ncbi:unnamed protein product [Discosporangium mesarthrocarpum]
MEILGNHSHDHDHDHDHGHDHSSSLSSMQLLEVERNTPASKIRKYQRDGDALREREIISRKLKRATVFVLLFFVVEIVGGIWAGSLAIITDAAHLLTDVSSFILAIISNEIATQPACDKLTYGPVRAEVLSALFSTALILVLSLILVYEAIKRIVDFSCGEGAEIDGKMMSGIAFLGLLVNVALLW